MGAQPDKLCFACQKLRYASDVVNVGGSKLICGPCARKFFKSMYRILGQLGFELKEGARAGEESEVVPSVPQVNSKKTTNKEE